ncbi:hypothetical protein BRCON_0061 [Candidatus Sumerlaea chitinivorans]|uniref:Uncharacterized protein n=1 Tax=Sumerlaea chitinivorans TaxID=2250252 RepID=A0A2Z4Y1U6_SUMC1|nr:hypothetical protein BRCON_0061 [Candidatus Sumerlaea chitinivorans]
MKLGYFPQVYPSTTRFSYREKGITAPLSLLVRDPVLFSVEPTASDR